MARKQIQSKRDGLTRDMVPDMERERTYRFPALGVTVTATSYQKALQKAKQKLKK